MENNQYLSVAHLRSRSSNVLAFGLNSGPKQAPSVKTPSGSFRSNVAMRWNSPGLCHFIYAEKAHCDKIGSAESHFCETSKAAGWLLRLAEEQV